MTVPNTLGWPGRVKVAQHELMSVVIIVADILDRRDADEPGWARLAARLAAPARARGESVMTLLDDAVPADAERQRPTEHWDASPSMVLQVAVQEARSASAARATKIVAELTRLPADIEHRIRVMARRWQYTPDASPMSLHWHAAILTSGHMQSFWTNGASSGTPPDRGPGRDATSIVAGAVLERAA